MRTLVSLYVDTNQIFPDHYFSIRCSWFGRFCSAQCPAFKTGHWNARCYTEPREKQQTHRIEAGHTQTEADMSWNMHIVKGILCLWARGDTHPPPIHTRPPWEAVISRIFFINSIWRMVEETEEIKEWQEGTNTSRFRLRHCQRSPDLSWPLSCDTLKKKKKKEATFSPGSHRRVHTRMVCFL